MRLGYDPDKNDWNIRERGLSFEQVADLNWPTAIVRRDNRKDYGEDRFQALIEGLDAKLYVVVFTMRSDILWVISFRRARERERGNYDR
jgi:uncharacterized DUF497 family protein